MPADIAAAIYAIAMQPLDAGRRVLEGIRRNDMYILTHPEFSAVVRARCEALLASMSKEALSPERVRAAGSRLAAGLAGLPGVTEVRGRGLLLGAEFDRPVASLVDACRAAGLLVLSAGETVLRLTPPLTVGPADLDRALATLAEVLAPA